MKICVPPTKPQVVRRVMQCLTHGPGCGCPAHSETPATAHDLLRTKHLINNNNSKNAVQLSHATTVVPKKEYVFEMASRLWKFSV